MNLEEFATTQEQLNQVANQVDPLLRDCPACGGQLRMEFKQEWRPVAEACAIYGVTRDELLAAGAQFDGFGRLKAGVPYVTCMQCGIHVDATDDPDNDERFRTAAGS